MKKLKKKKKMMNKPNNSVVAPQIVVAIYLEQVGFHDVMAFDNPPI